jgi:hypothetical protein
MPGVRSLLFVMGRTILAVAWLALCLGGCAHNTPDDVSQPSPRETPAPQQPAPETGVVLKSGGWQVPGLEGRKALRRTEIKGSDAAAPKMYLTEYAQGAPGGKQYVIQRSFFSEDERKALRLLPYDLVVTDLWLYDVGGRKYCYTLRVHPPNIGALQAIRFCDRDGDGAFEAAESVKYIGIAPEPPGWARGVTKVE